MSQQILERSQTNPQKVKPNLFEHTIVGLENPYELIKVKELSVPYLWLTGTINLHILQ